jgi:dihydrolipoamide dehydrogenase
MVVGELAEPADLVVVGGGPGGYTAALLAAEAGREVILVERGGPPALGGACLHVGCIPSKALIELATALDRARGLAGAGLVLGGAHADLVRFQAFKRQTTERLAGDIARRLDRAGVEVVHGEARFSRADRIAVHTPEDRVRYLEFTHAVLATGSRPAELPGLPFDGERILSSTDALALEHVPDELTVVGAGYIGVELGTAFAKLGSRVTIVEAEDRILPHLDQSLTRPVAKRLEALGVEVRTGSTAEDPDGLVLVATGRMPNTDGLGLDRAGAGQEAGLVKVGPDRRATDTIAAIGDIVVGPALAHRATAEAAIAVEALCGGAPDLEPLLVPAVVFSDPEVATVGLTEAEGRAAGLDVRAGNVPLAASGRAATMNEREGMTRVVVDRGRDRIVGVHVVGPHASELIGEGTLAIEMIAAPADLAGAIHPHPTLSELLVEGARA